MTHPHPTRSGPVVPEPAAVGMAAAAVYLAADGMWQLLPLYAAGCALAVLAARRMLRR